jgi:hypothetical protein
MTNGLDGVEEADGAIVPVEMVAVGVLRTGESTQDVSRIKVNRSATNLRFTDFLQTIDAGILLENMFPGGAAVRLRWMPLPAYCLL